MNKRRASGNLVPKPYPVNYAATIVALVFSTLVTAVVWYLYYEKYFAGLTLNDAMDYAGIARNVAEGQGFISQYLTPLSLAHHGTPQPDMWRAPLWPLALAGFQKIFGFIDEASAIGTGFFFIATSPVIYLLAGQWFNHAVALGAVLLYTFSPQLLQFSISGMTEPMSVFFMTLLFLVLTARAANNRPGDFLLGFVLGLFYLVRYNALLFLPLIALFRVLQRKSPPAGTLAAVTTGFLLAASPWLIRNTLLFHNPLFSLQKYEPAMFTKTYPDYVMYILPQKIDVTGFIKSNSAEMLDKFSHNWQEFLSLAGTPEFWGTGTAVLFLFFLPALFRDRKITGYKILMASLFGVQLAALLVIHFIPRLFLIFTPLLIIAGLGSLWLALHSLPGMHSLPGRNTRAGAAGRVPWHSVAVMLVAALLSFGGQNFLINPQEDTPGKERNLFPHALAALSAKTGGDDLILTNEGHIVSWYGNRYACKIPFSVEMLPEIQKINPVGAIFISNRILWHMPEADASWKRLFYQHPPELYDFYLYRVFEDKGLLYIKK